MSYNAIDDSRIPDTIRECNHWICWREEERDGKATKIPTKPYDTSGNPNADASNPDTWRGFEDAYDYHREGRTRTDGIGFVFSAATGIVGVDLDNCRDVESGELEEWAADIVTRLDSYTEVSPSGNGVHVLVRGELPPGRNRRDGVEMYDDNRFFTVTGEHLEETPGEVAARQDAITAIHYEYVQAPGDAESDSETGLQQCIDDRKGADGETSPGHRTEDGKQERPGLVTDRSGLRRKFGEDFPSIDHPAVEAALHNLAPSKIPMPVPQTFEDLAGPGIPLDDKAVRERAFASKHGDKIRALYAGESSLYEGRDARYPSHSEADMGLLFYLAFWTGKDPEQMDRLFRDSGLMRDKWDKRHYGNGATYGEVCLARTLLEIEEYYEPRESEDDSATAMEERESTASEKGSSNVAVNRDYQPVEQTAIRDAMRLAAKVDQQQREIGELQAYITRLETNLFRTRNWTGQVAGAENEADSGRSTMRSHSEPETGSTNSKASSPIQTSRSESGSDPKDRKEDPAEQRQPDAPLYESVITAWNRLVRRSQEK